MPQPLHSVLFNGICVLWTSVSVTQQWSLSLSLLLQSDADELVALAEEANAAQDRICQARAAGPGNHQKTVLLGCWRPGTHQCLYWWACCPGGYEGNVISHFILAWKQWDEWGTFCVRLFFMVCYILLFFFSSGLHREVYAHHAVAVFWCCGVLTWGWGCCSDRGRVCTCECSCTVVYLYVSDLFHAHGDACIHLKSIGWLQRVIFSSVFCRGTAGYGMWPDCCFWVQAAGAVSQTAIFSGEELKLAIYQNGEMIMPWPIIQLHYACFFPWNYIE